MNLSLIALALLGQVYEWKDSRGEVHFTDDLGTVPRGAKVTTTEGEPINVIAGGLRKTAKSPQEADAGPAATASATRDDDAEAHPTLQLGPLPRSLKPGDAEILEDAVDAARHSPRLAACGGLRRSIGVDVIDRPDDPRLNRVPEWAGGFAVSDRQVYLLSPYLGRSGGGRPRPWKEMTLHEVAHAQQQQWTGRKDVPRWFREGYAMYVSQEDTGASASDVAWWALRHGGASPLLHTWNSIGEGPPSVGHANRADHALFAYGVSLAGVKLCVELGGEDGLRALFAAMHEGRSFEAALEQALGLEERELERKFIEQQRPLYQERGE